MAGNGYKRFGQHHAVLIPGHIYLVRAENGLHKIGRATDVSTRFQTLQSGSPIALTLVAVWHSARANHEEQAILDQCQAYHVRGDWFRLPETLVAEILAAHPGAK